MSGIRLLVAITLMIHLISVAGRPSPMSVRGMIKHTKNLLHSNNHARNVDDDDQICQKYQCGSSGASCADNINPDAATYTLCPFKQYCSFTTSVCTTAFSNGASCLHDVDCSSSSCIPSISNSTNHVCNGDYSPGTSCSLNADCYFETGNNSNPYIAECNGGKCYGLGQGSNCAGIEDSCLSPYVCSYNNVCSSPGPVGTSCSDENQCAAPLICNSRTCATALSKGSACDITDDNCASTLVCAPTGSNLATATCIDSYSLPVGAYCADDDNCGEGLACNGTEDDEVGKCITGASGLGSLKSCKNDSDCNTNEACGCYTITGTDVCMTTIQSGNPKGIKSIQDNFASCYLKCQYSDINCIVKNCNQQYCAYLEFYTSKYLSIYPKCYLDIVLQSLSSENGGYSFQCSSTSQSSSINIPYSAAALMSILLVLAITF